MIKALLLIAAIACVSHAEGADWVAWNNNAAANYSAVHSISLPSPPSGFTRYVDSTQAQSSYAQRPNQYRYSYNNIVAGATCNIYCGPRSFLTLVSGVYVCKRDRNFWSTSYDQYCIPDVDTNQACNQGVNTLSQVGNCDMGVYSGVSEYSGYGCCYDDSNSGSGLFIDLTTRYVTTAYYNLRNAE